jgi:hypothetical protein
MPADRAMIILKLTPLPDPRPIAVRLRALLKYARRAQALRATDIRPAPQTPEGPGPSPKEGPVGPV